jgi:hypothetical protein
MRNINLEAAIWYLFSSPEFYEKAAEDAESTMKWFESLASARQVSNFGRNNQIYETFKRLASNYRHGAALSTLGDYRLIFDTAGSVGGSARGIMEQPLNSWMTEKEFQEFDHGRLSRAMEYSNIITSTLHNAIWGAISYFSENIKYPERRNDDDGLPGDDILGWYESYMKCNENPVFARLPDPLRNYIIDESISCHTGDEVPSTGVWYPDTGLEHHSLTFAIKGMRMQPVYKVIKTTEELRTELQMFPLPQTVAIATTWYPLRVAPPSTAPN